MSGDENQLSGTVLASLAVKDYLEASGYGDIVMLAKVQEKWEFLVGEQLAKVLWPALISNGVLHLNTFDMSYGSVIRYRKKDILSYLRVYLQADLIKNLQLHLAEPDNLKVFKPLKNYKQSTSVGSSLHPPQS